MILSSWGRPMRQKLSKLEKKHWAIRKQEEELTAYVSDKEQVKRDAKRAEEHRKSERKRLGLE